MAPSDILPASAIHASLCLCRAPGADGIPEPAIATALFHCAGQERPGWTRLDSAPAATADTAALLDWVAAQPFPADRPLVLWRCEHAVDAAVVARLAKAADGMHAVVVSAFDAGGGALSPLPEGCQAARPAGDALDQLLQRLAGDELYEVASIAHGACAFSPATLGLGACGHYQGQLTLLLRADCVVGDPADRQLRGPEPAADPRWPNPGSALDALRERLLQALQQPYPAVPPVPGPVLLHVLHGWGGGSARWVRDMALADRQHRHLLLRAVSTACRSQHGEALELVDPVAELVLGRWPLSPSIEATAVRHPGYREILQALIERWRPRALLVSSLIGHALDALDCGLACVWVAHDPYPFWPLLGIDPLAPDRRFDADELASSLRDDPDLLFRQRDPRYWHTLREAVVSRLLTQRIPIVAPSRSLLDGINRLAPELKSLRQHSIPHGIEPLAADSVAVTMTEPGERLRLVMPGRIRAAKGAELLSACMPELLNHAELLLLGAGREAEAFFGTSGVHVILDYSAAELPEHMRRFRPHAGLLLPTLAESFSYTLSELWSLGLPVIATRLGALAERIETGRNGLLVAPQPSTVIAALAALRRNPERLAAMQRHCAVQAQRDRGAMLRDHLALLPGSGETAGPRWPQPALDAEHGEAASRIGRAQRRLIELGDRLRDLQAEVQRRGDWGHSLQTLLQERTDWAQSLEDEVRKLDNLLSQTNKTLADRTAWATQLDALNRELTAEISRLNLLFQERTDWAIELDKLNRELSEEISRLNKLVDERTNWATELDELNQKLAGEISRLNELVDERTAWALSADKQNEELMMAIERLMGLVEHERSNALMLQAQLAEAEQRIADLEQALASLTADLQRGAAELAGTQADLLGAQGELASSQAEVLSARADLARTQAELLGAQGELASTQADLQTARARCAELADELERARARAEMLAAELTWTLNSRSMRLTQPLRTLGDWLRRRRAALKFRRDRMLTLLHRGRLSLRTRGLRGTLSRLREMMRRSPPTAGTAPSLPDLERRFDAFAVPTSATPRVSVVIPVFNKFDYTHACLRSIAEQGARAPFEVIVVDDGSSDETADCLTQIEGLHYLRNAENLGFVGACNAGALAARGDYLLFLNNDTVVTPGWLDALLDTLQHWPQAGLAGSMLVYPDGRLQEAGGIVFSDGSGWNYGRFGDPEDPAHRYPREVDYCSGAAIMLPRALFEQLGGFDTRYSPAYYEDTDLAFGVREAGYRVIYQPASRVIHFEGITSGTDTASGTKRYQVVNQAKFLERRAEALRRQPQAGTPIWLAREHRVRGRVLVIDACTPEPDKDSGSVRMVELLRLMVEDGWKVVFFADNRAYVPGYSEALAALGVEVLYHPWLSDPVGWFAEHGCQLDAVLLSRHYVASNYVPLVRQYAPRARLLFDTVDLHYLREQRAADLAGDPALARAAERTREAELGLVRDCDLTLVVSHVEQELLAVDAPGGKVEILSNIHEIFGRRRDWAERKDIVFVGGYQHPPNVDAAQWLVREILPLIRAEDASIQLHLIGSKAPPEVQSLAGDGVVFHGYVEDIAPWMDGCRIALAPLRYGAGVKGKVNMAMSYGLPVVATPPAVEGMHAQPDADVLVADTAETFAAAVLRAYRDPELWLRLSEGGLANVRVHFSREAARAALRRVLPPR